MILEIYCSNIAFSALYYCFDLDTHELQWKLEAGPKHGKLKSIHALLVNDVYAQNKWAFMNVQILLHMWKKHKKSQSQHEEVHNFVFTLIQA